MSYRGQRRFGAGMGDTSITAGAALGIMTQQAKAWAATLSSSWRPSGFYTADQILQVARSLSSVQHALLDPLESYIATAESGWTEAGAAAIRILTLDMFGIFTSTPPTLVAKTLRVMAKNAVNDIVPYVKTASDAKARGIQYVDAPGFRSAVLDVYTRLITVADGLRGMQAGGSWMNNLVVSVGEGFRVTFAIALAIGGVIKQVGMVALKVPAMLGQILTMAKWAVLVGGGLWVYRYAQENKGRSGL